VSDIARLDYSKLPTNYQLPSWVTAEDTDIAEVIKHAWRHFKAHNEPPGLEVTKDGLFGFEFHVVGGGRQSALSAAWAWYDRRLVLAERVKREVQQVTERLYSGLNVGFPAIRTPLNVWPHCLTWSDEQVTAVERWLDDSTAEMPEVLRG
jgi:hypothetical protein